MVKQRIFLVILMYFMQIYFHFLSENLQILSYFWIFCWPYSQSELYGKAKFKIRLNLKTNNIGLIINSNLVYCNFTKSRYKTLETMNDSNLRRNKAINALVSYVMNLLKSAYLSPSILVDGLYRTHWNGITELVLLLLVIIKSVTLHLRQAITY